MVLGHEPDYPKRWATKVENDGGKQTKILRKTKFDRLFR
jgi:hypothetical protein